MRTQLSATILLSCMANTAICDLVPVKRNSKLFSERDTFTGGDYLAHDNCTATMTSCNWVSDITPVTGCCPFSTVCDGIGGGGYCCPTSDDCGPSVDSIPRCADLSWSLWLGSGTGTHSIDGDTVLPKYYCCLADEIGLMNDTCVANTVVLAAGEKTTLIEPGIGSGSSTTTVAITTITSGITTTTEASTIPSTSTKQGILGDLTSAIGSAHTGTSNAELSKVTSPFSIWGIVAGIFGLVLI